MKDPRGYLISSLYFDDNTDSSYYEKLAGVQHRKKYRLRIYDGSLDKIMLECKEKINNKIEKRMAPVSGETYNGLLQGDFDGLKTEKSELALEVFALSRAKLLLPKVIVTYRREVYTHPFSETRITFDRDLDAGWESRRMAGSPYGGMQAFPVGEVLMPGAVILELKFDKYLPAFVSAALSHNGSPLAASKYVLCRDKLTMLEKRYINI